MIYLFTLRGTRTGILGLGIPSQIRRQTSLASRQLLFRASFFHVPHYSRYGFWYLPVADSQMDFPL